MAPCQPTVRLQRSLNVPAVRMLQQFGVERFYLLMQQLGMSTLNQPPSHYGLSLILGGAESTLWDVTAMYARLSRVLINFSQYDGLYHPADMFEPILLLPSEPKENAGHCEKSVQSLNQRVCWMHRPYGSHTRHCLR
jgi:penicillin-binding protein 1C